MKLGARELSYNILYDVLEKDSFSNLAIKSHLEGEVDSKEESLVREIVYGVLENEIFLDYIISKASKIRLKKIHPSILIILRIGVYQLVFMDKIPPSAAVNESVNLAKKHGHRGSIGFVNGVLRSISRDINRFTKIEEKNKIDQISIKYSHPKWMVSRWVKSFGEEFTEELCKANNEKPKMSIRVNNLRTNKKELTNKLIEHGLIIKEGLYSKDSLIIENPIRITELKEFKLGHFFIQDESSTLVGQILDPRPNSLVIDCCAAPGGKSTHLAEIMENKGKILSKDIFKHKINLINENANRLGISIIEAKISDATIADESLIGIADYLLIDAPCSGLGLIRRKPEIKRNRKEKDIEELAKLQFKILNNVKDYLKVGGILVYSTCTIEEEENIKLIYRFLDLNKDFKLVNLEDKMFNIENLETLDKGYIQLFPNVHRTDGFFIAKIIKER